MGKWRPLDWIVLVLALTVCAMLLSSTIGIIIERTRLTEANTDNLLNLVLALTAIINGYVVSTLQSGIKEGIKNEEVG